MSTCQVEAVYKVLSVLYYRLHFHQASLSVRLKRPKQSTVTLRQTSCMDLKGGKTLSKKLPEY